VRRPARRGRLVGGQTWPPPEIGHFPSARGTRSLDLLVRPGFDGAMDQLEAVFANLDRWRHLPNYQLERRADIFFSVYLRGLVEEMSGVALEDVVIPELPIKRDLIWSDLATDKSVKVDYVLFARDRSKVFFVELKTDAGSRRDAQDHYLGTARQLGFRKIVDGLCAIVRKTTAHQKYHHLLSLLSGLGYVTMPADIRDFLYPAPRFGLTERLRHVVATDVESAVEVIYVQPAAAHGDRCIDFERFAVYVERHDDALSRLFAAHLRRWRDAAGASMPT